MHYDVSQIKLKNIPELEDLEDGSCRRTYHYFFEAALPAQNILNKIAEGLGEKYYFSKDTFSIPEDVEIIVSVIIERIEEHQAKIITTTIQPEETCFYLFGLYQLPKRIESVFGTIQAIQDQPREVWIH